jgi:hypothetical protein
VININSHISESQVPNPIWHSPDGEQVYIYPGYTEFRPVYPKRKKDIPAVLEDNRKNSNRKWQLYFEYRENECPPGDHSPEKLAAHERTESRLYISQPSQTFVEHSKRGFITCVSQKSSVRLRKKMSRTVGLDLWIDLTFADDVFYYDGLLPGGRLMLDFQSRLSKAHSCLNKFQRIIKSMGLHYIWKKEIMPRRSGCLKGCRIPHYHVAIVGLSDSQKDNWRNLSVQLLQAWVSITGTQHPKALSVAMKVKDGEPQSYRIIDSVKKAAAYIGKYFSKTDPIKGRSFGSENESIGRAWGCSKGLPLAPAVVVNLTTDESIVIRRFIRKGLRLKKSRFIGVREQIIKGYSTFLFMSDNFIQKLIKNYCFDPLRPVLDPVPF